MVVLFWQGLSQGIQGIGHAIANCIAWLTHHVAILAFTLTDIILAILLAVVIVLWRLASMEFNSTRNQLEQSRNQLQQYHHQLNQAVHENTKLRELLAQKGWSEAREWVDSGVGLVGFLADLLNV